MTLKEWKKVFALALGMFVLLLLWLGYIINQATGGWLLAALKVALA